MSGKGKGRGDKGRKSKHLHHHQQQQHPLWFNEDPNQGRSFPAIFAINGSTGPYDLQQQPSVLDTDLAAETISDGSNGKGPFVSFAKQIFKWTVTPEHIAAGLVLPSQVRAEPGTIMLSLKQLVTLKEMFEAKFPNGSDAQFKWKGAKVEQNFGRERPSKKSNTTGEQATREKAWARLKEMYEERLMKTYGPIPEELLPQFRVDVYGNIVALGAVMGSLAAFSVDHIFPWSRGGLTREDNLMPLSEKANTRKQSYLHSFIIPVVVSSGDTAGRVVKNLIIETAKKKTKNKILNSKSPFYTLEPMPRGVTVPELTQLWQQICQDQTRDEGIELLRVILCSPWPGLLNRRDGHNGNRYKLITKGGLSSLITRFREAARGMAEVLSAMELTAQLNRAAELPVDIEEAEEGSSSDQAGSGSGNSVGNAELDSGSGSPSEDGDQDDGNESKPGAASPHFPQLQAPPLPHEHKNGSPAAFLSSPGNTTQPAGCSASANCSDTSQQLPPPSPAVLIPPKPQRSRMNMRTQLPRTTQQGNSTWVPQVPASQLLACAQRLPDATRSGLVASHLYVASHLHPRGFPPIRGLVASHLYVASHLHPDAAAHIHHIPGFVHQQQQLPRRTSTLAPGQSLLHPALGQASCLPSLLPNQPNTPGPISPVATTDLPATSSSVQPRPHSRTASDQVQNRQEQIYSPQPSPQQQHIQVPTRHPMPLLPQQPPKRIPSVELQQEHTQILPAQPPHPQQPPTRALPMEQQQQQQQQQQHAHILPALPPHPQQLTPSMSHTKLSKQTCGLETAQLGSDANLTWVGGAAISPIKHTSSALPSVPATRTAPAPSPKASAPEGFGRLLRSLFCLPPPHQVLPRGDGE